MSVMVAELTASSALSIPSTGFGGMTRAYAGDIVTTGVAETYTATTVTSAGWANAPTGGSPGDIVATLDGYTGIFVSATATEVTVDKWRYRNGGIGIPANSADCRVYQGKCILATARMASLHRIIVNLAAPGTIDITNLWGTVLYRHTIAGTAPYTVEFCTGQGEPGLIFDGPIAFKTNISGITATFVFSS